MDALKKGGRIDRIDENNVSVASASSVGTFYFIGTQTAGFTDGITGTGQRTKAYFNTYTNQFAVTVQSSCALVDNYYAPLAVTNTYIDSIVYRLQVAEPQTTENYSLIDALSYNGFVESDFSTAGKYLFAFFADALSLLGVGTSTISQILDDLTGTVYKDVQDHRGIVSVDFGLNEPANFDNVSTGVPVVFRLSIVLSPF